MKYPHKTLFDFTEEVTLTKDKLLDLRWQSLMQGVSIGLNEALEYAEDNQITRARELKTQLRTAQLQAEASNATCH